MAELRQIRAEILAEFDGDLGAYIDYLQGIEAEKRKRGFQYVDPPPRRTDATKPNIA